MDNHYDIENNLNQPYIPINNGQVPNIPSVHWRIVKHFFLYTMVCVSFLFSLYCVVLDIKYGSQDNYTQSKAVDIIIWYTIYSFIFNIAMSMEFQMERGIYAHLLNIIFAVIIILQYFRYYNNCFTVNENNKTVSCSDVIPLQLKVHVYMAISSAISHLVGIVIWGFCSTLHMIIN